MHIFIFDLTAVSDDKLIQAAQVLSASEKKRLDNMISVKRRKEFVLGHFILRHLLANHFAKPIEQIQVQSLETGALFLPDFPNLYTSISHSFGHLAIAFAYHPLGVDMEKITQRDNFEALLYQIDSFDQAQELMNTGFSLCDAFYHLWTRREATYKLQSQSETKHPVFHYHTYQDFILCAAGKDTFSPVWTETPLPL